MSAIVLGISALYHDSAAAEADATGGCGAASGQGVVAPGLFFLIALVLRRRRR